VHDVVQYFAHAEDALRNEGTVGPFQPIKRYVPKCGVSVDEQEPKREALLEEGQGDWGGSGAA
jgi:hypothetical protein